MLFKVNTIGCDEEYGTEKTLSADDGITIREMEIDYIGELTHLAEEVDEIQLEESMWDRYDGELTLICGNI